MRRGWPRCKALACSARTSACELGGRPSDRRAARRAGRHRPERGGADRPQRTGRQRGDPAACRRRRSKQTTSGGVTAPSRRPTDRLPSPISSASSRVQAGTPVTRRPRGELPTPPHVRSLACLKRERGTVRMGRAGELRAAGFRETLEVLGRAFPLTLCAGLAALAAAAGPAAAANAWYASPAGSGSACTNGSPCLIQDQALDGPRRQGGERRHRHAPAGRRGRSSSQSTKAHPFMSNTLWKSSATRPARGRWSSLDGSSDSRFTFEAGAANSAIRHVAFETTSYYGIRAAGRVSISDVSFKAYGECFRAPGAEQLGGRFDVRVANGGVALSHRQRERNPGSQCRRHGHRPHRPVSMNGAGARVEGIRVRSTGEAGMRIGGTPHGPARGAARRRERHGHRDLGRRRRRGHGLRRDDEREQRARDHRERWMVAQPDRDRDRLGVTWPVHHRLG